MLHPDELMRARFDHDMITSGYVALPTASDSVDRTQAALTAKTFRAELILKFDPGRRRCSLFRPGSWH